MESEAAFDDAAVARLKLAAEEVAWLTGRGYARAFGVDRAGYTPGEHAPGAIARVFAAAKELRPSLVKLHVDEGAAGAKDLAALPKRWLNLVGRLVETIPGAKVVRLQ